MKALTVIVTGASTGIGKAIAQCFLKHGHRVVINSANAENLERAYQELGPSPELVMLVGDISDKAVGQQLVDAAVTHFGAVDVLINNAGVFAPKPFLEVEEADLDRYLSINLKRDILHFSSRYPGHAEAWGRLHPQSRDSARRARHRGIPATAPVASKGGIHALTRQLAAEFGKSNIRVNTLAPGIIRTPLQAKMGVADADGLKGMHLLDLVSETADVAEMAYTLATNNFITGITLNLDGGHVAGHDLK